MTISDCLNEIDLIINNMELNVEKMKEIKTFLAYLNGYAALKHCEDIHYDTINNKNV